MNCGESREAEMGLADCNLPTSRKPSHLLTFLSQRWHLCRQLFPGEQFSFFLFKCEAMYIAISLLWCRDPQGNLALGADLLQLFALNLPPAAFI